MYARGNYSCTTASKLFTTADASSNVAVPHVFNNSVHCEYSRLWSGIPPWSPFITACSMIFAAKPSSSASAWLPLLYDTVVLLVTIFRERNKSEIMIIRTIYRDGILYYSYVHHCFIAFELILFHRSELSVQWPWCSQSWSQLLQRASRIYLRSMWHLFTYMCPIEYQPTDSSFCKYYIERFHSIWFNLPIFL